MTDERYHSGVNAGMNYGENQAVNQGGYEGTTQGMNQGMYGATPQGMNQGVNQGMYEGTPQGMNQGVDQGMYEGTPQGMNQGVYDGTTQGMNQKQSTDRVDPYATGVPQQHETRFWDENPMDPANPIGYIRDPHKLISYLIPFPSPTLSKAEATATPQRFLIYTPPPPPLAKPQEGVKEGKIHKVQRKWQNEVREAKTSTAKTLSWKGIKSKALKGISWAVDRTTTSNLDYLGRVADAPKQEVEDKHAEDGVVEDETTKKTLGVEELVLVYPTTMGLTPEQIREEFVNTMLRTKTKAQRDAIISSALLPITYGIDILATPVWPFGGLGEVDTVWAYATIRGAKTARSVTKRLSSSDSEAKEGNIRLNFVESESLEIMRAYLVAECHRQNSQMFPASSESLPTEEDVLRAIGWSPSEREQNWEDEQWEVQEVKLDVKNVMRKGAKEWIKWCKAFEKNPEKATKK